MQGFPGAGHTERLIIVAVVALVAAVLLPQWLHRGDDDPPAQVETSREDGRIVRTEATVLAVEAPNRLVVDLAGERVAVVPRSTAPIGDPEVAAAGLLALAPPERVVRLAFPASEEQRRPLPAWIDLDDDRNLNLELIAAGHARLEPTAGEHPQDASLEAAVDELDQGASPADGDHHP